MTDNVTCHMLVGYFSNKNLENYLWEVFQAFINVQNKRIKKIIT